MVTARGLLAPALGISLAFVAVSAEAQSTPPGNGTTPTNHQSSSQNSDAVAAFLADPASLLALYPRGGGSMVADVRDFVVADLQVLDPLLALVPNANRDQKNAIGTGLGLAAMSLVRTNPKAGTIIQQALAKLDDKVLIAAYIAVTGDEQLAAAGPGAGGSPGAGESATGSSSPTGGIGGVSALYPNFATINTPDTFTFPTLTTTSLTPSTPSSPPKNPSISNPVSPTR